ncbi:MAG: 30S ribosomal protein S6 [Rhodospirillales bacterium]
MPYYECVFIARQDISGPQVEALADHFAKVIEDLGGTIGKREYWGLRTLSYRIRKNRKGHYVLFNIDGPPAAVAEIDRQMRINEDVIRHLTVRVDALNAGPSQIMLSRSSRGDERDRDRDRDRPRRDDRDRGERRDREDRDRFRDRGRSSGDDEGRSDDGALVGVRESEGER